MDSKDPLLAGEIARIAREGRAAWPAFAVSDEEIAGQLAAHTPAEAPLAVDNEMTERLDDELRNLD